MNDIYSLLNINQGIFQDFQLLANRVADHQTEKVINKNLSKLKQIEERMLVDKGLEVAQQSIDEVISKVIRMAPSGNTSGENWTVRELRIVSYYLMKLRDESIHYRYALDLLNNNWKNLFFNGLTFYLLNSWHNIEPDYRTSTSQLLMRKLEEYDDSNRRYILWKNRLNLFDNNGPTRMAAMLSAKKMSIQEAPTLLGGRETSIKQSYFSDVIIKYVINNNITDRDTIEKIFELHTLDRTKKLIFAYLVEKEDQIGDDLRRAQLCRFAHTQLGDVTLATSWAPFIGATETEVQKLKKAMQLVNMWFAQQIIETFFEICVQDKKRKQFWLKYVNNISAFKIIGSTATKRLLQNDYKIGNMFLHHYIETNSYSSQTSALVLFIKNKMIVEFSDTGALYVYNQNQPIVKIVTDSHHGIASINELKVPAMNGIVEKNYWGDYSIYNEEGKMHHIGNWQSRLAAWINNIVLSSQNTSVSFMDNKHDDIFKEKPLPAENFKLQKIERQEIDTDNQPVADIKKPNATSALDTREAQFCYSIASKTLDNNVQVVANSEGFHLSLGENHHTLIKPFKSGEKPTGSILIKKTSSPDWNMILHNYEGESTHVVGFIRITKEEVIFKLSLSITDNITFKLK